MIIVEIAGFLGADPEERFTANGKRVVTLRVAARARGGGQSGQGGQGGQGGGQNSQGQDDTVWWRVNVWGDRFDKMLAFLKKGSAVIVIGEMSKPETYTTRDGTVQISLTLNADILKFSPFGRPNKPSEPQTPNAASAVEEDPFTAKTSYANQYASAGAAGQEGFAGDDLPF
jgi:single-strand DNA-binding protein